MTTLNVLFPGSGARYGKTAMAPKMRRSAALLLFMLWVTQALAAPQEECVGRYRLTLPSEAEVAMTTEKAFTGRQSSPIRFSDDAIAPLSSFLYNGTFLISRNVSQDEFDALVAQAGSNAAASAQSPYADQRFSVVKVSGKQSWVWKAATTSGFFTYIDGTAISFLARSSSEQRAVDVLDHIKVRADGEVPTMPGVCLPGVFISSSQPDYSREVGVTFRLKAHPDVLIYFRDAKALTGQPKLTSRQKNEFVWTSEFGVGKAVKLHGAFPWRTVKLDGREGVGSFATSTRRDDSTDYGYLVTVQGDPDAATDTLDLLLYVERNDAASQGKTPVTADELEKIGEEVAASLRRR